MVCRHGLRHTRYIIEHNANMGWTVKMDGAQLLLMGRRHIGLMVDIDSPATLRTRITGCRGQIDFQCAAGPTRTRVGALRPMGINGLKGKGLMELTGLGEQGLRIDELVGCLIRAEPGQSAADAAIGVGISPFRA